MDKEEWDSLRYPIQIQELSPEEGGGWFAFYPDLGECGLLADGETPNEAIEELEAIRRGQFQAVVTSGVPIVIPVSPTDRF